MKSSPSVILLMRKDAPGYYSIERLFECLAPYLSKQFDIRVVRVPCHSRGLLRCVRNLLFAAHLRADVIHVTGDIHYCALAIPRRRCVLTIHDFCSLNRLSGLRKLVLKAVWYQLPMRWARLVTVISEETRNQLHDAFRIDSGKVHLVPNCVDQAFWSINSFAKPKTGVLQVLQIGTGVNKNLDRVAAAASGLSLWLRIIGPLSYRQRELLGSLDLAWTSAEGLSSEELLAEYVDSDVLIYASTYEGFGLPIVEAQAIGLPVITSDIPPMTDTAGKGALLVNPYDEGEIREAFQQVLQSPDVVHRLIDLGRRNAARFDAAIVAGQYADIYTCALRVRAH